jgi:transcriptional regulator with XRE-family HTH domain
MVGGKFGKVGRVDVRGLGGVLSSDRRAVRGQPMPTAPARVPLADAIRRAIHESGKSFNELGRLAGIDPGQLSRFASGNRDLTVAVASRVCLALGFELSKTGEAVSEPLLVPPPSTRNRAKGSPPPASAFSRGQGRRVDLDSREEPTSARPTRKEVKRTVRKSIKKRKRGE